MECEINPGNQQKYHRNHFNQGTVKVAHAGIVGRVAANCDGGKSVTDCIEKRHSCGPVSQAACHGQTEINIPERFSGFGDSWRELGVLHRSRRFRAVKLHATDTEHRQYRHCQHNNSHST